MEKSVGNRSGFTRGRERDTHRGNTAVVSGYLGYSNVGDDMLLEATVEILHRYGVDRIVLSGAAALSESSFDRAEYLPEIPGSIGGLVRMLLGGAYRRDVVRALFMSDLYVVAGGTVLAGTRLAVLRTWLIRCLIAKLCGCRIVFLGVGVGNLNRCSARLLVRLILALVDRCSIREEDGWGVVNRLLSRNRTVLSSDLVFGLQCPATQQSNPSSTVRQRKMTVAFCLPYFFPAEHSVIGGAADCAAERFRDAIAGFADRLARTGNYEIVFVPFQRPYDEREIDCIEKRIGSPVRRAYLSGRWNEIADQFSGFDAVVAMRYHSLVFASLLGIPALPIEYSDKVTSLVAELGLGRFAVKYYMWQDVRDAVTPELLHEKFGALMASGTQMRQDLATRVAALRTRGERNDALVREAIEMAAVNSR